MFRIRRVFDDALRRDKDAISQAQEILRSQFSALTIDEIEKLPHMLKNPLKYSFRTILFVADNHSRKINGFAIINHDQDLNFCFLDFLSIHPNASSRGIGGALYERVREEANALGSMGIFFECLPDDPNLCRDPEILKQNKKRLRFYENYGAYPIINTKYETPLKPDSDCPPYLVFDPLGKNPKLPAESARLIVKTILERKYTTSCPPGYVDMVIKSFQDNPVKLRQPKYLKKETTLQVTEIQSLEKRIAIVITDMHEIHHVRDRGYVEAPARISRIFQGIKDLGFFDIIKPEYFSEKYIRSVHKDDFVTYLKKMCNQLEPGRSVYPYVFPIRNAARPPVEMPVRAGYYCIDTFTPLNKNAYVAAKRAVDCALTAANAILEGYHAAYALVRPPGHHAERKAFGGFCYFNSTAIAAEYFSRQGKVAVIDIDYHHGNGTQNIFYKRKDVLTVSIHGNPKFAYPYFSGFADEKGTDDGHGYNINFPLKEELNGEEYYNTLVIAVQKIQRFNPDFLVIALGYDTSKGDPTGTWNLYPQDFEKNGKLLGSLGIPTLIMQEGGYKIPRLAGNAMHFFRGLRNGILESINSKMGWNH